MNSEKSSKKDDGNDFYNGDWFSLVDYINACCPGWDASLVGGNPELLPFPDIMTLRRSISQIWSW